jgi:hypothetical protein
LQIAARTKLCKLLVIKTNATSNIWRCKGKSRFWDIFMQVLVWHLLQNFETTQEANPYCTVVFRKKLVPVYYFKFYLRKNNYVIKDWRDWRGLLMVLLDRY